MGTVFEEMDKHPKDSWAVFKPSMAEINLAIGPVPTEVRKTSVRRLLAEPQVLPNKERETQVFFHRNFADQTGSFRYEKREGHDAARGDLGVSNGDERGTRGYRNGSKRA